MKYELNESNRAGPHGTHYNIELGDGDMLAEMKDGRLTVTFRVRDDIKRTSRFRLTAEETRQLKEVLGFRYPAVTERPDLER